MIQSKGTPHEQVNPPYTPYLWVDLTNGEIYTCIDNTIDANVWIGQSGSLVGQSPEKQYSLATANADITLSGIATQQVGYVELTDLSTSADGGIIYSFSSIVNYLEIGFEGYVWGGTGADGISIKVYYDITPSLSQRIFWRTYTNCIENEIWDDGTSILIQSQNWSLTEYREDAWNPYRLIISDGIVSAFFDNTLLGSFELAMSPPKIKSFDISGYVGGSNDYHRVRNLSFTAY